LERVKPAPSADEAYEAFAWAYDQALGKPYFATLSNHLERLLSKYSCQGTHLDVACGTGNALEWFTLRGFTSCGIDASVPMLGIARDRASRLVAGDMRGMPFRGSFDLVTSFYDSFNHLLSADDLVATFRAVRSVMHDGSLFWFDMNHPSAYPRVWDTDEPFVAIGPDYELSIDTAYSRFDRKASGWVHGFATIDGRRVEIDEIHFQRPYSEREIRRYLRAASLEVLEMFRFSPFGGGDESALKFFFITRAVRA
jgi:SAM-dependent methyltransferase